jgi:hypothetical protein
MSGGTSGFFSKVDFDVLVLAETKDGKPSVRVGDAEIKQVSSESAKNSSRVKFAVHARLPKGSDAIEPAIKGKFNSDYDPLNYDDS